jgi:hypothetical protein
LRRITSQQNGDFEHQINIQHHTPLFLRIAGLMNQAEIICTLLIAVAALAMLAKKKATEGQVKSRRQCATHKEANR